MICRKLWLSIIIAVVAILLTSCAPSVYKKLQVISGDALCIEKFRPGFEKVLYQTSADVAGNHLSGILLIKQMPDSSTRLLFTNEAGFKFFDFEFSQAGAFKVHYIIEKMNKDAVKTTLKKDFQLILFNQNTALLKPVTFKGQAAGERYFSYNSGEDYYYYITDAGCSKLLRMERGSSTKKVLEAFTDSLMNSIPERILIHHTNFNFDIDMKRIWQE